MVRYLSPEDEASPDRLSPLYASKYGANTWVGIAVAAWAVPAPVRARPAEAATVARPVSRARKGLRTRPVMDRAPFDGGGTSKGARSGLDQYWWSVPPDCQES